MTAAVEGASRAAPATSLHVIAVVVTHDGARWLAKVLDGLAASTRPPDQTVVVDTGSQDESYNVAVQRLGAGAVIRTRHDIAVGAAVAEALQHAAAADASRVEPQRSWVWLLHDDSNPAPDALAMLLREAVDTPEVGIVGPKLREWPSLRRLLEVGVTITGTGHRETGLEAGEPDQGQHDRPRDVLAVSSAGMLVRRDVWSALGGFDPQLPFFGDDVDFGWRANRAGYRVRVAPEAVVFHAEAASRGLRGPRPTRARRRAAVYTLLANASPAGFGWQYVRLLAGSLVRVLGLLLAKAPRQAWDELRGTLDVYLRPWRLLAARRARRRTASRPAGEVRTLLPSPALPYRRGVDAVLEGGRALLVPPHATAGRRVQGSEPGPVAAEAENLPAGEGPLAQISRHPWAAIVSILTALALWSGAGLLGDGLLQGGALLPAPDSVGRWWGLYVETWHPVGIGSAHAAPPYALVLALAGTVLAGQPWLVVDLLLLAAVPLCALSAHRLARRLFRSPSVQVWWSLTYALVPVVTGAVGQGRIGTVVGAVVAPLVANAALALVLRRPGPPAWQQAVRLGLWLSLLASFVPLAYPMVASLVVLGAAMALRGWRWLAVIGALLVPAGLLGPWLWSRWADPFSLWWEAGLPDAGVGALTPHMTALLGASPGGPVTAPAALCVALLGVALTALVRTDRQRALLTAWLVALAGLGVAVAGAGTWIELPTRNDAASVWVGFPLVCWWGGLAVVAGLGADGAEAFLARHSFGWRQPLAVAATVVGILVPLAAAGWWAWDHGTGVLRRGPATPLPDYLGAAATAPVATSTLVLSGSVAQGVTYALVRDDGTRLGEEPVAPTVADRERFDAAVVGLLRDPSPQWVSELADYGVGAVYALPPVDDSVAGALDSAPGLRRSGAPDTGARAWQFTDGAGSVRVLPDAEAAPEDAVAVAADRAIVGSVRIGATAIGGQLRLAAPAAASWIATGPDGELPPSSSRSGVQAFFLAGSPTQVHLAYDSSRRWWVWAQLGLLVLALLAAAPGRRKRR